MHEKAFRFTIGAMSAWEERDGKLHREFTFANFSEAWAFMSRVALLAEKSDHHPDIILSYRKVRLELSTHAEGGLTDLDFQVASEINAFPTDR